MAVPGTQVAPQDADALRRIRYRLIGARYELVEALIEAYELDPFPPWIAEVERARIALAAALAWLDG